uniref:Uncharacterized protein n=1 Tax=Anguilla anguilla TaxID=7936 RepID=A0A0E9VXG8_ANGAN
MSITTHFSQRNTILCVLIPIGTQTVFKKQVQLIYYVKVVFPRIVGVLIYCMKAVRFPV